jgi:WD40 repeat protein/copper chaperone CopZ
MVSSQLWAQERLIRNLKGFEIGVTAVAISPDSKTIAAGGKGSLVIFDLQHPNQSKNYGGIHREGLLSLTFTPDGKSLVSAGGYDSDNNLKIIHLSTENADFIQGQTAVTAVAISKNGKYLVSGGLDRKLRVWDLKTKALIHFSEEHIEKISDVAISDDGQTIVSSGGFSDNGGEVICLSGNLWQKKLKLGNLNEGFKSSVNSVDISSDGKFIVSASKDGTLRLWNAQNGQLIRDMTEPYTSLLKVRFSPDGRTIATIARDKAIRLWDSQTGQKLTALLGHTQEVTSIAFSSDGQWIVSGSMDNTVKIWRANTYKRLLELEVQTRLNEWMQRGKYEKSLDYQTRVNEESKAKMIEQLSDEIIQRLAQEIYPTLQAQKTDYDPDNETFKVQFKSLSPIYINVPIAEAEAFDRNLPKLEFRNPKFTLSTDENFVLMHVEVFNPVNQKMYFFDSQEVIPFNPNELNLKPASNPAQTYTYSPQESPQKTIPNPKTNGVSEVDVNLPKSALQNPDAVAVVIGNAQYQKTQSVDFAVRDARSVRNYLIEVMGYKPNNILYYENATLTDLKLVFGTKENPKGKLFNLIKPEKSDVFVYYSGHGAPGLNDKKAYLVPTECDPQYVELTGFETDVMYDNLAQLPAKSIVMALDACFSGENIYKNISPIVIKSKGALGLKNGALLASSGADQVSAWYNDKGHGLFTYFFLKAIHNRNADKNKDNKLTLEEIYNFIADNAEGIPYYARRLHGVQQNPVLKGQNPHKILVEYAD